MTVKQSHKNKNANHNVDELYRIWLPLVDVLRNLSIDNAPS